MTSWFVQNLGWKILSLLIAVFLFASFSENASIEAFVSVPVEYRKIPDDLEISSEAADTVSVDLRGSADEVKRFSSAPAPVVMDFSSIHKPGQYTFYIDGNNLRLPAGMRLVRAIPSQLRFQFEHRTARDVPVQVRFSGQPPPGYVVVRHEAAPPALAIIGPDSRVRRVEYAVTDPIDLSNVVGRTEFHVNAFIGDPHVRFVNPVRVAVTVTVEKR